MQKILALSIFCCLLGILVQAQPGRKFDSTMKLGKVGYKVYCSNKAQDKNNLTISPVGFENTARDVTFEIKGRVFKAEVDDLNRDGFPDLLVYVHILSDKNKPNIIGVSSDNNQGFRPIYFPDILDDPKIKIGYKGMDEYYLMEGTLVRKFPIFNLEDTTHIQPTGMYRQVMYKVVAGERGELKFKVSRSYDFAKQQ
ncbi:MAG: hypothetical protein WCH59_04705 [Chitinophagia bacterium]|jgi:hypothetical protein